MYTVFFRKVSQISVTALIVSVPAVFGQNLGTVNLPSTIADAGVQIVDMVPVKPQQIGYCEGPVVKDGTLYFSEQNAGIIWKVTASGTISKWMTMNPAYVNGLDIAPSGNLAICEMTRITERDYDGNLIRVITSGNNWGQGANDLTFASNGDMFFTAFNQHFWFHSADSTVNRDYNFNQPSNINFNGIEYIEEKGILYACQWGQNKVLKYSVNENREVNTNNPVTFASIAGPDGITVDENYNVYIASNNFTTGGIYVYDSTGNQLGNILMRQDNNPGSNASNCVFGGPENKTLYITGDNGAYKVQLKVAGRVRPGNTAIVNKNINRHSVSDVNRQEREFIISRTGNQLQLSLTKKEIATCAIYMPSGKKLHTSSFSGSTPLLWQPPSSGIYVVRVSLGKRTISKANGFDCF